MPILKIAHRLGVAPATVRRRLDRLKAKGVVQFITAVDPEKVGYWVSALIGLQVDLKKSDQVREGLSRLDEVTYASAVMGSFDFIITAVFRSEEELYDFLTKKMAAINGVQRTETFRVLKVVKRVVNWGVVGSDTERETVRGGRKEVL